MTSLGCVFYHASLKSVDVKWTSYGGHDPDSAAHFESLLEIRNLSLRCIPICASDHFTAHLRSRASRPSVRYMSIWTSSARYVPVNLSMPSLSHQIGIGRIDRLSQVIANPPVGDIYLSLYTWLPRSRSTHPTSPPVRRLTVLIVDLSLHVNADELFPRSWRAYLTSRCYVSSPSCSSTTSFVQTPCFPFPG